MRNYHAMGGETAGPIDREQQPLAYRDKLVAALPAVLLIRVAMIGVSRARRPISACYV